MTPTIEAQLLEEIVPKLEADGFEVFLQPSGSILPRFLKNYRPDAIARRGDKKLAIEVKQQSKGNELSIEKIAGLFHGQDDWDFRVFWIPNKTEGVSVDLQKPSTIRKQINEILELSNQGHQSAAFLVGWATLEALARSLLKDQVSRPQTPGRVVELLASDGMLTPSEADVLRSLISKRNNFVHGDLKVRITKTDVNRLISPLKILHSQIQKSENA